MKIITLEEHYLDRGVIRASAAEARRLSPHFNEAYDPAAGRSYSPSAELLEDLGEGRLADMDRHGITMQVLSCLTTQQLPSDGAAGIVTKANDRAAAAVRAHPDRFRAFAALPTVVPEAAAAELERCVRDLGFVGTMIMGRTEGEFLDEPRFDPILAKAVELHVPIYLHPAPPPRGVVDISYDGGLDPVVGTRLATSAWGWHQETAVHFLHLLLSGVFDRYPTLKVILGHWGEMIPFYLDRIDEALPRTVTGLDRTVPEYFLQNVFITPSGMFSQAQLQFCVATVGIDRILYSVDYPFIGNDGATAFLEQADLPDKDKRAIASVNSERVLRL